MKSGGNYSHSFFVDIMVKYASVSSKISFHIPYVNIF